MLSIINNLISVCRAGQTQKTETILRQARDMGTRGIQKTQYQVRSYGKLNTYS